jgi:hypothetical protein
MRGPLRSWLGLGIASGLLAATGCGGHDVLIGSADGTGTGDGSGGPSHPFFGGGCRGTECPLSEADSTFLGWDDTLRVGWAGAAIVGDLDGDGYDEIALGGGCGHETERDGAVFLIYGGPDVASRLRLDRADARLTVGCWDCQFGGWIAGAGDVNGDGLDDFVAGAPGTSYGDTASQGSVYIVPGSRERYRGIVDIGASPRPGQTRLVDGGIVGSVGFLVDGAGDVDGDGLGDVLAVALDRRDPGRRDVGAAYLVYGSRDFRPVESLDDVGVLFLPEDAEGACLQGAAGLGDIDGDGYDDFAVEGATVLEGVDPHGVVHVGYGRAERYSGTVEAATLDGSLVTASSEAPWLGRTIRAGDFDGDGLGELVAAEYGGRSARLAWGSAVRIGPESEIALLGPAFVGGGSGFGEVPWRVAALGDVDGDGLDDLVFADAEAMGGSGVARLFLGRRERPTRDLAADDADFSFFGPPEGERCGLGLSLVAGRGDVNGDGLDDFLIVSSAHSGGESGTRYGCAYLVLGARR